MLVEVSMRRWMFPAFGWLVGALWCASASAAQMQGVFARDDDVFTTVIHVETLSRLSAETFSYAGGRAASGSDVQGGGFIPVLSLFSSTGDVLQMAEGGSFACGSGRREDATSGFCWDAHFSTQIGPGDYTLVLTQDGNLPAGALLGDGFTQQGQAGYTGELYAGDAALRFVSPDGFPRSGHWFVQVLTTSVSSVPESSTLAMLVCGLLSLCLVRRR